MSKIYRRTLQTIVSYKFVKYIFLSMVVTGFLYAGYVYGLYTLVMYATSYVSSSVLKFVVSALSGAGGIIVAWLLLPVTIPLVALIFQEPLALAIEHEYPGRIVRQASLWTGLCSSLKFLLLALLYNLVCMPLYSIPLLNMVLYYSFNAYLLGSQLFEELGARYFDRTSLQLLKSQLRVKIFIIGFWLVLLTNLPLINLLVPLIAVVLMVHMLNNLSDSY